MAKSKKVKEPTSAQSSQKKSIKKEKDPENKVVEDNIISNPTASPPQRKRRMASLNAEFFVRYSSASYVDLPDSPILASSKNQNLSKNLEDSNKKGNESLTSNSMKRKRTMSAVNVPDQVSKSADSPRLKKKNTPAKKNIQKPNKLVSEKADKSLNLKTDNLKNAKKHEESDVKLNITCPVELISSRPKREAGARASAMIIQTSEFEKLRRFPTTKKDAAVEFSEKLEKEGEETMQQTNQTAKKTTNQIANSSVVETKKRVAVKALKKNPVAMPGKKINPTKKESDLSKVDHNTSTTIASSPPLQVASKSNKICDKLTEEVIKEHNSQNGSLGRGSGSSFTNVTKMYIVKWTMENILSDERPFEEGQIPIENFGVKILDQPQYLKTGKNKGKNFKNHETVSSFIQKDYVLKAEEPNVLETNSVKPPVLIKKFAGTTPSKPVEIFTKITVAKSIDSSLSGSVPLVVDETPIVRTDSATGMSLNSPTEKPHLEVTITTKDEKEEKNYADKIKNPENTPYSVLKLIADSKKITENVENLIEKDIKNVLENPIKNADSKLTKSVLNTVTALENIETTVISSAPTLNEIKANVLSELMNESSNTNYSMED